VDNVEGVGGVVWREEEMIRGLKYKNPEVMMTIIIIVIV